jgi:hypothetical protein
MADDNPYRSPETREFAGVPEHKGKRKNSGCVVLILLALPLFDTFAFIVSHAGPYAPTVLQLGLGGFACGAALGVYVSVKIKHQSWWSSCRWAIYGLVGMCLPAVIILYVVSRLAVVR